MRTSRQVILGLMLLGLWAFPGRPFAQFGSIKTMTVEDGLVMNWVRGFYEDRHGFIWIYTYEGVSRYEGSRFRNFVPGVDLSHGVVNDMWEAANGDLYLPLNNGTVEIFRDLHPLQSDTSKEIVVNLFHESASGSILVGTDLHGLQFFENGKLIPAIPEIDSQSVLDVVEKDGFLYLLCANQFYIYRTIPSSAGQRPRYKRVASWEGLHTYYHCVIVDHDQRVLVGSVDGVFEIEQDAAGTRFELRRLEILPDDWKYKSVMSMASASNGQMWYATLNGLFSTAPGQPDRLFTIEDGLPSNKVYALMVDENEMLWIGTDGGVALLHLQSPVTYQSVLDGTSTNYLVVMPDGSIHGVADHSIKYTIRGEDITFEQQPYPLINGLVLNASGLHMIVDQTIEPLAGIKAGPGLRLSAPQNVLGHGKRIYWCDHDGVFVHAPEIHTGKKVLSDRRIEALAAYNDTSIVLGSWNEGLYLARVWDEDPLRIEMLGHLSAPLPGLEIRSVLVSRSGDIWVGTRHDGLIRLRCKNNLTACRYDVYNTGNGAVSNWITAIAEDHNGHIWVGTVSGLFELIPDGDQYRVYPISKAYAVTDRIIQVLSAPDSTILFVTSSRYGQIVPGRIRKSLPGHTYITDFYVNNQHQAETGQKLVFQYKENNLRFEFATPAQHHAIEPPVVYRLLGGRDTSWSAPVYTSMLNFANLTPGDYTLQVAYLSWSGVRGIPAQFQFTILRPFWLQAWFIVLCFFLFLLFLSGLYLYRMKQVRRLQLIRDRIAADLHDEIGSSLTHVNILAEIGKNGNEPNHDVLERIGKEAQSSAEALDDIIWSVKSRADVIDDVISRMRQYATEVFESSATTFELHEKTEGAGQMDLEQRRDLYLIYKELIRNIQRHAHAGQVTIRIQIDRQGILLEVSDNGEGFDAHAPTHRNGVENIRQRVSRWKGIVTWQTKPGEGTRVILNMPRQG